MSCCLFCGRKSSEDSCQIFNEHCSWCQIHMKSEGKATLSLSVDCILFYELLLVIFFFSCPFLSERKLSQYKVDFNFKGMFGCFTSTIN